MDEAELALVSLSARVGTASTSIPCVSLAATAPRLQGSPTMEASSRKSDIQVDRSMYSSSIHVAVAMLPSIAAR